MQSSLVTLLLVLSAIAPPLEAAAAAVAHVSLVPGRSITLGKTGFASGFGPPVAGTDIFWLELGPGESTDLTFDYAISVRDDGLLGEPPVAGGCIILGHHDEFCGPPPGLDREMAAAIFNINASIGLPPGEPPPPGSIEWTTEGPSRLELETNADSFADSLSQSGTIHFHAFNPGQSFGSISFFAQSAVWVVAAPIPEPTIFVQIAAGLGLFAICRLVNRRRGLRPAPHANVTRLR